MFNEQHLKDKSFMVLESLLKGNSFNRFEAEIELHDHCLPSTISYIQTRYKITVCRELETFINYQGCKGLCCRYWIEQEEIQRYKKDNTVKKKSSPVIKPKEAL